MRCAVAPDERPPGALTEAELHAAAARWQAEGRAAVLVEVVQARGSVPREAGTRMLVDAAAALGTIGGGHLELQALQQARSMLAQGAAAAPQERQVALGPSLGQCCGGALRLRFTPLAAVDFAAWQVVPPRFHLQLYGAGHVGRAIVRLLADIDCRVRWLDTRADEFPGRATLPPHVQAVAAEHLADEAAAEVAEAPAGALHLVLTHSHALDLALAEAILRRGDFGWFGLIGSATKRASFEHRLRERGIAPGLVERMACPIGLPGIDGKQPAVIAVAVVAQLLQLRH